LLELFIILDLTLKGKVHPKEKINQERFGEFCIIGSPMDPLQ